MSESTVSNVLKLNELPAPILNLVDAGAIPRQVGAELAKIEDPVEQAAVAEKIVTEGMSREDAFEAVKSKKPAKKPSPRRRAASGPKPSRCVRIKMEDYVVTITARTPFLDEEAPKMLRLAAERAEGEQQKSRAA